MKIALDARPLSNPLSGIGRYTHEILKRIPSQSELTLLSDEPLQTKIDSVDERVIKRHGLPYSIAKLLWQQQQIPQSLRQIHPDLFWSPRHHLPLFGCKKIPMVLTIHDLVYRKMPETMKRSNWALEKLLLAASVKRADHVIAVSEATRQSLIEELHTPSSKITVIHSGYVELGEHAKVDLSSSGINKSFILFLGSMEPRKNIDRLLSAYLALPQDVQDQYQLVLAGGKGWNSEALFKRIEPLPKGKVVYLGYVDDAMIYSLFKQATVFAFPSLYEGFGLPILEAMSLGCPVLTSTDPACVEVANDAAIHVDPLSIESISQGLQKILTDIPLRQNLMSKGYENIKRFSWDIAAKQHLTVFQQVLSQAQRQTDQRH